MSPRSKVKRGVWMSGLALVAVGLYLLIIASLTKGSYSRAKHYTNRSALPLVFVAAFSSILLGCFGAYVWQRRLVEVKFLPTDAHPGGWVRVYLGGLFLSFVFAAWSAYALVMNWAEFSGPMRGNLFWYLVFAALGAVGAAFVAMLFFVRLLQDFSVWQRILSRLVSEEELAAVQGEARGMAARRSSAGRNETTLPGTRSRFEMVDLRAREIPMRPSTAKAASAVGENLGIVPAHGRDPSSFENEFNQHHQQQQHQQPYGEQYGNHFSPEEPAPQIPAAEFEQQWNLLPESGQFACDVESVPTVEQLQEHLEARGFSICAQGVVPITLSGTGVQTNQTRVFFYCVDAAAGITFLAQLEFTHPAPGLVNPSLHAVFKCTAPDQSYSKSFVQRLHLQTLFTSR
jgi:hypothetical protein